MPIRRRRAAPVSVLVLALMAGLLLAPGPLAAQRDAGGAPARVLDRWPAFTTAFDRYLAEDSIVGGAAILVHGGRIVRTHHTGHADRAAGMRIDSATIFHYGSITKTLTAVAIMQLRDRGLLSLDDPVTRYLPELRRLHDPFGAMDSVTIAMLLSHSAGFQGPTWPYGRGRAWEPFEPTTWEQLVAMMPYQQLHFRPGSRYGYSNPTYIYLARIVEQLTGDPWAVYVQKNIFAPLGMHRSYFGGTPYHLAAHRGDNYTLVRDSAGAERLRANGRDFDPGITIPNGGWNAPLGDLAIYASFLAGAPPGDARAAARYEGVLRRATLEEMWQPLHDVDEGVQPAGKVGLGFFLAPRGADAPAGAPMLVGHAGEQAGYRAMLQLDRTTGTALVYALNTTNAARPDDSTRGWWQLFRAAVSLLH